jgi:GrpB-like predicted nucleotidyltransferase (UPF0157 family)
MIRIEPYSASWPGAFAEEAAALQAAFGPLALRIDHVGSTAVAGLAAKPIIDIQISVAQLQDRTAFEARLARLQYVHVDLGDFDRVYPFFAKPGRWPNSHHVHLCVAGSAEEVRHLAFRDHLRADPGAAAEYERLKRALAAVHHGRTLESREAYSLAKTDFVEAVLAKALRKHA